MKCRHTTSIAAHLLGALDPADALELERHYRTCADCRDEVILLAPLPGLLHRAGGSPPDEDHEPAKASGGEPPDGNRESPPGAAGLPPDGVRESHAGQPPDTAGIPAPARRGRRLRFAAVGGMLALLAASGAAGYVTGQSRSTPPVAAGPPAVAAPPAVATANWSHTFGAMPGFTVTADLTEQPWGTQVRLHLGAPPSSKQCRLVVFTRDGTQQTTGWWTTGYYTDADITTSTSVPLAEIVRLEIFDTTDNLLAGITK
ncbi:anti-sigma factor family protein [Amycolatopsis taiwanensis]|uniref:Zinc-finger domain-containing protein n=1 Tax=Amycolatopsis taiwanensis TaxID=342230 RepID=A0A9W6QZC1_9PSEU|nr:zf-HC2 domain-containing protein [Amycolatopsis taiwanensis]GLY66754.1 hypothetical protein Atai01_33730 [Amycolatopsis taiwanensis]